MLKQNIMLSSNQENLFTRLFATAKIGGKTTIAEITGTQIGVVAAAYGSGDVLGTGNPIALEVLTTPNGTAILQSLVINDLDKLDGAIDVVVFNDNPTATTFTDNAALDINDADLTKVIHSGVSVTASNYKDFNDNSSATVTGVGCPVKNASATDGNKAKIWVAFVSRDTKTYTSNNSVSAKLGFLQD